MPGFIQLGCLLGQYGGTQSFESVGSWGMVNGASSLYVQSTDVRSSPNGARWEVYSEGAATRNLQYNYGAANDLYRRWSPDVNTHGLTILGAARVSAAAYSGFASAKWIQGGGDYDVPFNASLQPFRLDVTVSSGDNMRFAFQSATSTGSYALYFDDLLPAVDLLTLYPDRDATEIREQQAVEHTTRSGRSVRHVWNDRGRWTLPMRLIPSSEAAMLNRWWQNGFNLLLIWDSSDTAQNYIVRAGGSQPPFMELGQPYTDLWNGTLTLEGVSNGGVY